MWNDIIFGWMNDINKMFKILDICLFAAELSLVFIHVMRRSCWCTKQKRFHKFLHNNSVKFPKDISLHGFVHQHGCRDTRCKPPIKSPYIHCNLSHICLPTKMASETMKRSTGYYYSQTQLINKSWLHQYTLSQNGRHFSILLFPCKLTLIASLSKAKRTNLQSNKRILKWRPFWNKVYRPLISSWLGNMLKIPHQAPFAQNYSHHLDVHLPHAKIYKLDFRIQGLVVKLASQMSSSIRAI